MRSLASGVFLENRYPGVQLGAVAAAGRLLLIDAPIRVEDAREWLGQLSEKGRPRYVALLDHHPDRVLGARGLDLPILAHDETRIVMSGWPDTYKGGARPMGAEADRLKRVSGVGKAVPDLTFSDTMSIDLDGRTVLLVHRPGPMAGAIWVVVPDAKVVFVGDAVWMDEPPYLGEADLDQWQETLDDLASGPYRAFTMVSARDGVVDRKAVKQMGAWLGRLSDRMRKLGGRGDLSEAAGSLATALMRSFKLHAARKEQAHLRLQAGLERLYVRLNAED